MSIKTTESELHLVIDQIKLKPNSILFIRGGADANPAAFKAFHDALVANVGRDAPLVICGRHDDRLEMIDEETMRHHGWIRAK